MDRQSGETATRQAHNLEIPRSTRGAATIDAQTVGDTMRDAHSSHPGNDETAGDAYAGHPVSAAEPRATGALSFVAWTKITEDDASWPENGAPYLVATDVGEVAIARLTTGYEGHRLWESVGGWDETTMLNTVTHWAPCPPHPRRE